MNVLTVENLTKSYGEKILLNDISFGIDEGEKIGVIGVNGTGKSTLLKVLTGIEAPERGKVTMGNTLRMEYLPQNPDFAENMTVLEQVFKGNSPEMQLLRDYEAVLAKLNHEPENEGLQKQLMTLSQKMDELNVWQLESEAKTILTKLGISEYNTWIGTLSGGQRKRVALASSLINPADILMLDEPTNHIDNATVDWLEQYLNKRKGALIMITHDRYFLDRVANRIFELDRGKLYTYPGNYSRFLELKAEREELAEGTERKRQNLLRNELAWMRRGAQARTTKQKARIERFEKLQEDKPPAEIGRVEISTGATRLGKKVIEFNHVYKEFPGRGTVMDDFSYIFTRHDRIGIIGPNGSGKSTLLNLIANRLEPDSGEIERGLTVNLGYFAQENTELNPDLRVIDYIKEVAEVIPTSDGGTITASQLLERFLFPPAAQWTPIRRLSGGEKRRLYLLRILMGVPNVLLLDEPTNDLDIQTLTILEDYLDEFPGVVIAVSHDRFFLDRVAERIFAFEGQGKITSYVGNYSEYREQAERLGKSEQFKNLSSGVQANSKQKQPSGASSGTNDSTQSSENSQITEPRKERPLKMSFKEQKEYEQIEELIAQTEEELAKVNQEMNQAGSNYARLQELAAHQQALEHTLEERLERWTYLNELAEKIAQAKK